MFNFLFSQTGRVGVKFVFAELESVDLFQVMIKMSKIGGQLHFTAKNSIPKKFFLQLKLPDERYFIVDINWKQEYSNEWQNDYTDERLYHFLLFFFFQILILDIFPAILYLIISLFSKIRIYGFGRPEGWHSKGQALKTLNVVTAAVDSRAAPRGRL